MPELLWKGLTLLVLGTTEFILGVLALLRLDWGEYLTDGQFILKGMLYTISLACFGWQIYQKAKAEASLAGGWRKLLGNITTAGIIVVSIGAGILVFGIIRILVILDGNGGHFDAVSTMLLAASFLVVGSCMIRGGRSAGPGNTSCHDKATESPPPGSLAKR